MKTRRTKDIHSVGEVCFAWSVDEEVQSTSILTKVGR